MPGFFTDYSNNKVLDQFFGAVAFTPPGTLYVGLSQSTSNKAGSIVEPTGGGYARIAVANSLTTFPAAAAGTKSNAGVIAFPSPSGAWGTLQSVFLADAAVGGNVLAMADLATSKTINAGAPAPTIAAGALFFSHT